MLIVAPLPAGRKPADALGHARSAILDAAAQVSSSGEVATVGRAGAVSITGPLVGVASLRTQLSPRR